MQIPKPPPLFIILTLFVLPLTISPLKAQSPPLNVTVFTNQQIYCLRQPVAIYGTLTLNGPVSNGLIALHVDRPGPTLNPIIIRTLNTGTNPPDTWLVQITKVATCRDWEGLQETDRFKVGTRYAYFKAIVKSNALTTLTPLLTINIYDGNMVPIGTIFQTLIIAPNGTASLVASNEIPSWAYTGNAIAYANLYTDWPFLGGTPYCPEASHIFKITNRAEIASDNPIPTPTSANGTYSTTLRISPEPTIGQYTVYISTEYGGEKATAQTTFEVKSASYPPTAAFDYYISKSATPHKPYPGGTVTFDASASTPDGGTITSYKWTFGDGTPKVNETDPITYHIYTAAGNYTVTLNITDSEGLWSNTSKQVQVWKTYGPKANFTYKPSQPIVNGTTKFDASTSTVGWNGTHYPSIVSYKWNFGDGNITTTTNPIINHIYRENKTYTVKLNVTDAAGRWNATSAQVTVIELAPGHSLNISVTLVPSTPAPNVYKGWIVNVTVLVKNNGTFTETFDVTAFCNTTSLGTKTVTALAPGANTTLIFTWNTTQFTIGNYTIKVEILNPPATALLNVKVKGIGDVDGSGYVDWADLGMLGLAYETGLGHPYYNPEADFDGNNYVNWVDLGMLGLAYETKT